jgi:uncharacterized protein YjdB
MMRDAFTAVLPGRRITGTAIALVLLSCGSPTDASRAPVATVTVSPTSMRVVVGSSMPLEATPADAHGTVLHDRDVFWTSSDTTVSTVSSTGVVTAHRTGTARIVASAEGEFGSATVTVTPPPVATVAVTPADAQALVGSTVQLQALTYDESDAVLTGRAIAWSSSDARVATVDETGRTRAIAPGSATITATSEGKTGHATITVLAPVDRVDIRPSGLVIVGTGRTAQLTATTYDAHGTVLTGRPVAWTTSDPGVATVDATGLVTGVSAGGAVITASAEGKSATARILVSGLVVGLLKVHP